MKQALLAILLIAIPVAAFTAFHIYRGDASTPGGSLGDLSSFKTIVADVQAIAATGDLAAAEKRITDFETGWDDAEGRLRPLSPGNWGNVDQAADAALHALRAAAPSADVVGATLTALAATLDDPGRKAHASQTAILIVGIAVTDESGHAIPCEDMITSLRGAIDGTKVGAADLAAASAFLSRATERCNADDDQHADEFSAQGLALAAR
ncbi:MAG: hypothetical protein ABI399_00020 [Bauldia sp.]